MTHIGEDKEQNAAKTDGAIMEALCQTVVAFGLFFIFFTHSSLFEVFCAAGDGEHSGINSALGEKIASHIEIVSEFGQSTFASSFR